MCGISGIVSEYSNLENYNKIVKSMLSKISYRGPDSENIINITKQYGSILEMMKIEIENNQK